MGSNPPSARAEGDKAGKSAGRGLEEKLTSGRYKIVNQYPVEVTRNKDDKDGTGFRKILIDTLIDVSEIETRVLDGSIRGLVEAECGEDVDGDCWVTLKNA